MVKIAAESGIDAPWLYKANSLYGSLATLDGFSLFLSLKAPHRQG